MTGGAADTPFNAATTGVTPSSGFLPLAATTRRGNSPPSGDAILMYFAFSTSSLLACCLRFLRSPPRHPLPSPPNPPTHPPPSSFRLFWEQVRLETRGGEIVLCCGKWTRRFGPVFDTVSPTLCVCVCVCVSLYPSLCLFKRPKPGAGQALFKKLPQNEIFSRDL